MRLFKDNDNSPCAENRLTETQLVMRIQLRYKLTQRQAREQALVTVAHLRYQRQPSSNTDVWNCLLADESYCQFVEVVENLEVKDYHRSNCGCPLCSVNQAVTS